MDESITMKSEALFDMFCFEEMDEMLKRKLGLGLNEMSQKL